MSLFTRAVVRAPVALLRFPVVGGSCIGQALGKGTPVMRSFSSASSSAPGAAAPPATPPAAAADEEDDDAFFRRVARDYRRRTSLAESVVLPDRLANGGDGGGLEMLYARNRAAMLGLEFARARTAIAHAAAATSTSASDPHSLLPPQESSVSTVEGTAVVVDVDIDSYLPEGFDDGEPQGKRIELRPAQARTHRSLARLSRETVTVDAEAHTSAGDDADDQHDPADNLSRLLDAAKQEAFPHASSNTQGKPTNSSNLQQNALHSTPLPGESALVAQLRGFRPLQAGDVVCVSHARAAMKLDEDENMTEEELEARQRAAEARVLFRREARAKEEKEMERQMMERREMLEAREREAKDGAA